MNALLPWPISWSLPPKLHGRERAAGRDDGAAVGPREDVRGRAPRTTLVGFESAKTTGRSRVLAHRADDASR